MGWGGARVGAGKKPGSGKTRSARSELAVFPGGKVDPALADPPRDLPANQQPFWREWAPMAIEKRTLTAQTVPSFRLLCELEVRRRAIGTQIDKEPEPSPMGLRVFAQYAKQVEALMARFCLAPFGKPAAPEKPKAAASPWGVFAAGGQGGK